MSLTSVVLKVNDWGRNYEEVCYIYYLWVAVAWSGQWSGLLSVCQWTRCGHKYGPCVDHIPTLWPYKQPGNFPDNDEWHLPWHDSRKSHLCLPWWYSHLHKDTVGASDNYLESARTPPRVQLVPQAGGVWIWVNSDRISWSNCLGGNCRDGSGESVWSIRMAGTLEQKRSPVLCQIHKFLPMVHQGFLSPCVCPVWPH